MAQQLRMLAVQASDQSLIPGTHVAVSVIPALLQQDWS